MFRRRGWHVHRGVCDACEESKQVLYDGVNAIQELSGTTPVVNRLTGSLDEFFARTDASGTTFPLTDALGSTIALTDATGNFQTQYTYEPFGSTTPSGATSTNTYQFTGRVNDGTGLYFYRVWYYDPAIMRFISQDPLGLAGGVNPYVYAEDNPTSLVGPLGLSSLLFCRQQGKLYLLDDEYNTVGIFDAATNVQGGLHPWPSRDEPYTYNTYMPHRADPNGKFGSSGTLKFDVPGRNNMEVHSGHSDETDKGGRRGYNYATNGCIRTTDEATKAIKDLNETDPLNTIQVHDSCPSWMTR
jgi:RHS repeat-associated protein